MAKVNFENINPKIKINIVAARKAVSSVLKHIRKSDKEINILLVSNQKIRFFNRKYLRKDRATDVIAFGNKNTVTRGKDNFLGDIVVSTDKAGQNAKTYGMSLKEEIYLCIIHGILHLCGYDDISSKDRKIMKEKEDELLQKTRKHIQ